jgi:hypothetical protein
MKKIIWLLLIIRSWFGNVTVRLIKGCPDVHPPTQQIVAGI